MKMMRLCNNSNNIKNSVEMPSYPLLIIYWLTSGSGWLIVLIVVMGLWQGVARVASPRMPQKLLVINFFVEKVIARLSRRSIGQIVVHCSNYYLQRRRLHQKKK
jgi:hypothetical protein